MTVPSRAAAREILDGADDSLLDLVYLRLTALLCAADRVGFTRKES